MNFLQIRNAPKSSSKRRLESLGTGSIDIHGNHHSKRQCLDSDLRDDLEWVKIEISDIKAYMTDIKAGMNEIAEYLRGEVDDKLEDITDRIQQLNLKFDDNC